VFGRKRKIPAAGVTSFHAWWVGLPREPIVAACATIEVLEAPRVDRLYFWALQVTFASGPRRFGGAHTGLQWNPRHPGNTAVNWGGYEEGGDILGGSDSSLAGFDDDPHTRDFAWRAGRPYRFRVERDGNGWLATVDDVVIRTLFAGGNELVAPVVWAEVFAHCDDPPTVVRFSDLEVQTASGAVARPDRFNQTFPDPRACRNNTIVAEQDGLLFLTNQR
jgi:hypothetical protein